MSIFGAAEAANQSTASKGACMPGTLAGGSAIGDAFRRD
jgi:hypothetical protein